MKIFIIGSTSYKDKMVKHQTEQEKQGHVVVRPAFDDSAGMLILGDVKIKDTELSISKFNRLGIEQCDEVHVIWDARSTGTIFDMGMAFALHKPVKLIYINDKTFVNLFRKIAGEDG